MDTASNRPPRARRFRFGLALLTALGLGVAVTAVAVAAPTGPHKLRPAKVIDPAEAKERALSIADRIVDKLDGSEAQRTKLRGILGARVSEVLNLRAEGVALRERAFEALMRAPRPDRAEAESLRAEAIALADRASRVLLDTFFEASAVLDDAQLAELRERLAWLYD